MASADFRLNAMARDILGKQTKPDPVLSRFPGISLLVPFLCFSHGLAADDSPPPQVREEIIVQGYSEKILSTFVKPLASAGPTDQVSRWNRRPCLSGWPVQNGPSPALDTAEKSNRA
jgi:hypothetical protein